MREIHAQCVKFSRIQPFDNILKCGYIGVLKEFLAGIGIAIGNSEIR
jgi:hypothetical protein